MHLLVQYKILHFKLQLKLRISNSIQNCAFQIAYKIMHLKLHLKLYISNPIQNCASQTPLRIVQSKLHFKCSFQTSFKICISNSSLSPHFLTKVPSYSIPTQTTRLLIFYSNHSFSHSLLKPLAHSFST